MQRTRTDVAAVVLQDEPRLAAAARRIAAVEHDEEFINTAVAIARTPDVLTREVRRVATGAEQVELGLLEFGGGALDVRRIADAELGPSEEEEFVDLGFGESFEGLDRMADDFLDAADAVVVEVLGAKDNVGRAGPGVGRECADEATKAVVGEVLDERAEDGLAVDGWRVLVELDESVPGVVGVGVLGVGRKITVGVVVEPL